MSGKAFRRIPWLVILTALTGCDNVAWGGVEVGLEPPPSKQGASLDEEAPAADPEVGERGPSLPTGPVLYAGSLDDGTLELVPVAEIGADSLAPLPWTGAEDYRRRFVESNLGPGAGFVLFADGVRVGRLTASAVGRQDAYCDAPPSVTGVLELIAGVDPGPRFLALAEDVASGRPFETPPEAEAVGGERASSLDFAAESLRPTGVPWPPTLAQGRADLSLFRLEEGLPAYGATFVYRDRLDVTPAPEPSWGLFVLGVRAGEGYRGEFAWLRRARVDGKGVPRYFQHLDWDGDGSTEVLLDVVGEQYRWTAALDRRAGRWVRVWQTPCGERMPPPASDSTG